MTKSTLYSRTSTGAIQQWQIEVQGDKFRTISGQVDGAKVTTEWTICFGKNIGKNNETSPEQQAILEAESKWKLKIKNGYFEKIEDIDNFYHVEPMLAHNYSDYEVDFPVFSQPKLDGIRCIATKDALFSRKGNEFVSIPHIAKNLIGVFKKFPNLILDGELYTNKLSENFNKITSIIRKTKPTKEDLVESEKTMQYWIYDVADNNSSFSKRLTFLQEVIKKEVNPALIKILWTVKPNKQAELDSWYEKYLEWGYEGQIIRTDTPYENKRTKNLLKRKEFQDAEYKILDIIEGVGNRTGTAGYMEFVSKEGKPFKSNIKGNFDFLKRCLRDRKELIGKEATIKYFRLTPDGIPRFPFVVEIRDYE